MLRWNPHFHAIVLEGGFDEEGTFFYIPFSGLQSMVEVFRRRVIKLVVERKLLNEDFARNLLSWKHSGFSIDNSVRIFDESAQESLAEYIARPPISLKKIRYEPFKGGVISGAHSAYPAETTTADSPLRFVCFPDERAVGRNALGCTAGAGRLEDFSLNGIGHGRHRLQTAFRKRARGRHRRAPTRLGPPAREGLRGRPDDMSQVRSRHEGHRCHRGL